MQFALRYLREGTDLMPVSTFLESFCGVFGACVGTAGVLLATYSHSMLPDTLAAIVMSGTVGLVALGLLSRSSTSLLGQTLPLSLVLEITMMLEHDPVVVAVYDVKTEVLGVDTARFKAEIEFNADAITRRRQTNWADVAVSMRKPGTDEEVEDWVSKNDSLFLVALTTELKRLESQIKQKLSQFKTVHVDLEPW